MFGATVVFSKVVVAVSLDYAFFGARHCIAILLLLLYFVIRLILLLCMTWVTASLQYGEKCREVLGKCRGISEW